MVLAGRMSSMVLTYFPLWAKGPGPALALAHSGLEWRGAFPADWPALKPTTTWSKLPLLEVRASASDELLTVRPLSANQVLDFFVLTASLDLSLTVSQIGHELAILAFIGRVAPAMGGESDGEWAASQQIMCECEDIYAKLTKYQPTTRQPVKCAPDELRALWTATDSSVHNRDQGLQLNLANLDAFAARAGHRGSSLASPQASATVGACKLFSTLHALVLIEPEVLRAHERLDAFYDRFAELAPTRAVLDDGGAMPGAFAQYFVRGDVSEV